MKRLSLFFVALSLFILSCSINDISGTDEKLETADLEFSISLTKTPVKIMSMSGYLSKSNEDTIWFDFVIKNDEAYYKVTDIKAGAWELTVNAYNTDNILAYSGSTTVTITPGEETTVYLHLDPATGNLNVIVTWDNEPVQGLVAYYPFNGNALDESGNGNDGKVCGALLCDDRFGSSKQAYHFDGLDDFIVVNSNISLDVVSVAIWIKPSYIGQEGSIIFKTDSYENDWGIFLRDSLHILDDILDNNKQLYKTELSIGWHFVVAVIGENRENKLYVDGELVGSGSFANGTWSDIDGALYIGQRGTRRYNGFFNGKIDDISIYNRALSDTEIKNLFNKTE